jgi:predicted GNAT family acetyltransferase
MNVIHDKNENKFYITVDNSECKLLYKIKDGHMDIYETFVPPAHRGGGMAEELVREAMEYARENNLKVKPTCPYIKVFFRKYSQYRDLEYRKI